MKITFKTITIDEHPVVWTYDETTHTAKCHFSLSDTPRLVNKESFLKKLRNIPGIEIRDGEAIINDTRIFFKEHPFTPLINLSDLSNLSAPNFFSKSGIRSSKSSRAPTPSPSSTVNVLRGASLPEIQRPPQRGISLDALIPRNESNSGLWGDTLSYEAYFKEKTNEDVKQRQYNLIKTESNFLLDRQYKKNRKLYKHKGELIAIIRHLFDEILNPIFERNNPADTIDRAVAAFFQEAISKAMVTSEFDKGDNEFLESMPLQKQAELFDSPRHYAKALANERKLRAEIKFEALLFFIRPEILSQDLTENLNLIKTLDTMKSSLKASDLDALYTTLNKLLDVYCDFRPINYALRLKEITIQKAIKEHHAEINNFYSFYHLVKNKIVIKGKHDEVEYFLLSCIENAINIINKEFFNSPTLPRGIARLKKGDPDFYMSLELANLIEAALPQIKTIDKKAMRNIEDILLNSIISCMSRQSPLSAQVEEVVAPSSQNLSM